MEVPGVIWNEPGLQSAAGTLWKLALLRQCVLDNVLDKSWTLLSDKILAQVITIVTDARLSTGPKHNPAPPIIPFLGDYHD